MNKAKKSRNRTANTRTTRQTATSSRRRPQAAVTHPAKSPVATKQAKVLNLLSAPAGATIAVMMKATGWQQHSVRGFLAAVVRKRLKLDLTSIPDEDGRIYRISAKAISASKSRATKSAA